ncbi:MAG TPA: MbnP family protein, partial [Bacteroidia bacterium]|nr:MbnP family protein [Bacteroidia bacterium]
MNLGKKITISSICLVLLVVISSFKSSSKAKVHIQFKNYVGNAILQLDSTCKNALGQDFTITNFKYYIGNICLKKAEGKTYTTQEYFLINEHEEDSKQITLNDVPEGNYTSIEFIVG